MLEKEADNLSEYWSLENKLMIMPEISREMLTKAIELRASDIMIHHHICQKITKIHFNKKVLEAIQVIEVIRDIEADLRQYKKDIKNNDFNIYCMFTRLYGSKARSILSDELKKRKILFDELINELPLDYKQRFVELKKRYYIVRPPICVPMPYVSEIL
jgi:hypothetical protein